MNKEQLAILDSLINLVGASEEPIIEEVGKAFIVTIVNSDTLSNFYHVTEDTYTYIICGNDFKQISHVHEGWERA